MSKETLPDAESEFSEEEKKEIRTILNKRKKRYTTKEFLDDVHSKEPNNVKAITKAIIGGAKIFVKESPHPFVGFLKETGREIFS